MDPILSCRWLDQRGEWELAIRHNGTDWELLAAAPFWSESLPFADPDEVRRFAQALLDLPAEPEPYEFEWQLSRTDVTDTGTGKQHDLYATLTVGLDPLDDHRPYLAYQSYHHLSHSTALGMEVICEDPPVDHLRAQAHAFLTNCPGPPRR
ncbi:hypothetical protein ACFWIQ_20805 [Kitasatospora sp. NPDC127059]|uniref:hypothetical protein n=1 Tax=unclassified Kitasatospora TaxID=2633591 RepID=UPI003667AC31